MRLYREVDDDDEATHSVANLYEIDRLVLVKPIEITEKDISEILAKYLSYSSFAINDTSTCEVAKAILSKLTGE